MELEEDCDTRRWTEKADYYCFVQWVKSLISSFALVKSYAIAEDVEEAIAVRGPTN